MNRFVLVKISLSVMVLIFLLWHSTVAASGPPEWKQIEIDGSREQNNESVIPIHQYRFIGVSIIALNVTINSISNDEYAYEATLLTPGIRFEYDKMILKYFSLGIMSEVFALIDNIPLKVSNGLIARIGIVPRLVIPIKEKIYLFLGVVVGGNCGVIFNESDFGSGIFIKPILGARIFKKNLGASFDVSLGADWLWKIQNELVAIATAVQLNIGAVYRF